MSFLRLVLCCLTIYNISEGKSVQGIIGQNVSLSWTFKHVRNDDVYILHNESRISQVLPLKSHRPRTLHERVRVLVTNNTNDIILVTVDILNITENDTGMYRVIQVWKYQDLDDSVHLKTIDEALLPKIAIVGHDILNSALVLECKSSNLAAVDVFWKVNGTMIGSQTRYSQNNKRLSIRNLTADDQYNLYRCNESESGLESDAYSITISGPSSINFAPNITMVHEYSALNVFCLADCYPLCSWKWRKFDLSLGQENVVSTNNVLYIQNVTRYNTGIYSCGVMNKITRLSLENVTPIQIVYGPGIISFNSSDKIIQLNENDSITISCSADCFPPCQIGWTETNAEFLIPGGELKLVNVRRSCNYTCHATNERKNNTTISDTIYVIVKPEITHYTTTAMILHVDAEEFPFKRHLLYIFLGIGIILAVAFLVCLRQKISTSLSVRGVPPSHILIDTMKDVADKNLHEEVQNGNYWTIVSDEEGEFSSAIETEFERRVEKHPIGQNIVPIKIDSNQPVRFHNVKINEELDGYLNPIHSRPDDLNDYIHPIHSGKEDSDFQPKRHSTSF